MERTPKKTSPLRPGIVCGGEVDVEALDAVGLTELLNGIPGAYEAAQQGLKQAREGKTIPLDEL
jgi:hypothetical protein